MSWNPVEHQLRSWTPRNPSAKLKERLFPGAQPDVVTPFANEVGGRWAWLAPVMGCFLAMLVVSGSRTGQYAGFQAATPTNWLAAVASNQSYAADIAGSFHSDQNALQRDLVAWTNVPRASGEVRSFPLGKTNSLIY